MTTTPTSTQRAAALALGSIALLMIGLQPLLLGELVERKALSLEGVGLVAMAEIIAIGLGVIAGDAWLPPARLRVIAVLAALAAAAGHAAALWAGGDAAFLAVRALTGLAEGTMVWVATSVIVRSPLPDRLAGLFLVAQTLAQAAAAALLALVIIPLHGWPGGFVLLGVAALGACAVAQALPRGVAPLAAAQAGRIQGTSAWAALGTAFLQMAAIGAVWAYLEPLGRRAGLDAQAAQTLVSGVLVLQVMGGAAAAALVRHWGTSPTLAGGACMLAALALAMLAVSTERPFVLSCAAFGFVWLFLMPFHIRLALDADARGSAAVLVPAAQLLGSAAGPLGASLVVEGEQAAPVPGLAAALALASLAALWLARRGLR